jgi:NNP family nitrate/nitrite transporter-like MFS transporter
MSDIKEWKVEDAEFWESTGKKIATRNLWISIPSLLCGFAVWLMWGIITVQMLNLGFPFAKSELFTLAAIAGLTGATLRIPSSFLIRIAGGRNTIVFTTALLMIPAIGTAIILQSQDTPLWQFQLMAFLSGFGGGNFASSMSNISFFFPKKVQGTSLGLNAGLGNFGVTTMQILIPLVMTFALLGPISGDPMTLQTTSGTLIGKIQAGSDTWIQNAGFVWLLFLVPLAIIGWKYMNNLVVPHVSPDIGNPAAAIGKIIYLLILGFICAAIGLYFILPPPTGLNVSGTAALILKNKWFVLPCVIASTLFLMRYATPSAIKENLKHQFKIFGNSHTWVMTVIYIMTFGSFIGYSAAAPLCIKVIFGFQHIPDAAGIMTHNTPNPAGPSALMYAWMGPFIGALIRPIGGKLSDRFGGARITHWATIIMIASALGVSYFMAAAYQSATPQDYFAPFMILFVILFTMTGIGNGSTFRTISQVFDQEQAGPVLGWTSAVAAYGAFIMPKVLGEQIKAATPQYALYGFAAYYTVCLILNYVVYLSPGAKIKNP